MDNILNTIPETYTVTWISGKLCHTKPENPTAVIKGRMIYYSWYKSYYCHRSGQKEIFKSRVEALRAATRPLQKASKNIGCPASMKVTYYKDDPNNVVFTFHKTHNNEVVAKDDFCLLPVSETTKDFIMQKLVEGYEPKNVCVSIQRQLNSYLQSNLNIAVAENYSNNQGIIHRDQVIDQNEEYNQYK